MWQFGQINYKFIKIYLFISTLKFSESSTSILLNAEWPISEWYDLVGAGKGGATINYTALYILPDNLLYDLQKQLFLTLFD